MRVACVLMPDFEVRVERARDPRLIDVPLVLGGASYERAAVRRVSAETAVDGVREGMPLREAAVRCPSAVFLPYDSDAYDEESARVHTLLGEYSSVVKPAGCGLYWLDASGWGRIPGRVQMARELLAEPLLAELGASVGVAPSRFTSRLAAARAGVGGLSAVPDWMEPLFLSDFPVEQLPLGEKNLRKLRRLGIHTIGEFAALPAAEMKLQFGAEGRKAHALAVGEDRSPLSPAPQAQQLSVYVELNPPIRDLGVVRGLLLRECAGLCEGLGARTAREVKVTLTTADGQELSSTAALPVPSASLQDISLAAERALQRLKPEQDVERLELRLLRLEQEAGRQISFWDLGRHTEVTRVLAGLRDRFGPDRLVRAVAGDASSLLPAKQFALVEQP